MSEPSAPTEGLRRVTDAASLRALTHPTRIALIETLTIHGPMTATQAAEYVGESPSSCSFHLRRLAAYGFVEEAGGGHGRRRPWKMTAIGFRTTTVDGDPAANVAAAALSRAISTRQQQRHAEWGATAGSYPEAWRRAATDSEFLFWLTPEELAELNERLVALLMPYHRERLTDPDARPEGALPVELLLLNYPIAAPAPNPEPS